MQLFTRRLNRIKYVILALAVVSLSDVTLAQVRESAQPQRLSFTQFGSKEGLPTKCIINPFIDSKGRVWINPCYHTALTLNMNFFMFDGTNSHFYQLPGSTAQISIDSAQWLVIGETTNAQLFGFDRAGNTAFFWSPVSDSVHYYRPPRGTRLLNIISDKKGSALVLQWYNNEYSIVRLNLSGSSILGSEKFEPTDYDLFSYPYPFAISDDRAWFFHSRKGLVNFNTNLGSFSYSEWGDLTDQQLKSSDNSTVFAGKIRWKIHIDQEGNPFVYLGQQNGFFSLKDEKLLARSKINDLVLNNNSPHTLKVHFIEDQEDQLLIITGYTLGAVNTEVKENFKAIRMTQPDDIEDVTSLFNGILDELEFRTVDIEKKFFSRDLSSDLGWVSGKGVNFLSFRDNLNIASYKTEVGLRSIYELDSARLLIHNDANLTFPFSLAEEGFAKNGIIGKVNTMSPIKRGLDGNVWAALWEQGFLTFVDDYEDHEIHNISELFAQFEFISADEIVFINPSGELFNYRISTGKANPVYIEGKHATINAEAHQLVRSTQGILWIAADNGLWKYEPDKLILTKQELDASEIVFCIKEDRDGILWVGTANSGIIKFDPNTGIAQRIGLEEGLSSLAIAGILTDEEGNFWVSTFDGINVISPLGNILFNLSTTDGLANDEFNRNSYLKLSDGRLVFGGIEGFSILDPKRILQLFRSRPFPEIHLTSFESYNESTRQFAESSVSTSSFDPIKIPADHRYLVLNYAMTSYHDMLLHKYAYRIIPRSQRASGSEEFPWINLGAQRQLVINSLPAGDFLIEVKGVDHEGFTTPTPLLIGISVREYFYKTWWFFSLCLALGLVALWRWIAYTNSQKKLLQLEVKQRTATIQRDKEIIEKQAVKLAELDKSKTRIFTNISHEFRTPLTVIMGMAAQIKEPVQSKSLIYRNANRLLNLVNQILDLRKLESGNLQTSFVQGDVVAYIRYIFESMHSFADRKNIDMQFVTNENSLILDYDPEKTLNIISNLLTNAVKYTSEGGKVTLKISCNRDIANPEWNIHVSDTGIGISEEKLPYIFDRFFQVEDNDFHMEEGTGVGLTLVKELVQLLDGNIDVKSKVGIGTVFTVTLPLTNIALAEENAPNTAESNVHESNVQYLKNAPPQAAAANVLIVEDNSDLREYMASALLGKYQISFAHDGRDGINKAIEKVPDIIISDVIMPYKNGYELCQIIKNDERTSHIPVILLTAKADLDSKISGLKHGADAYLNKPFNLEELEAQLTNLLILREKLRERYSSIPEHVSDNPEFKQEDEFMIRLRQIILNHMADDDFGVASLCKLAGMSRTQLHNKVKALSGNSASQLIRSIRINEAEQLLMDSNLNISQIALEVGIQNLSYFSQVFSEVKGISPKRFRENHISQQ